MLLPPINARVKQESLLSGLRIGAGLKGQLNPLQPTHVRHRLSASVAPPADSGTTWSTSISTTIACQVTHYAQRPCAGSSTVWRSNGAM
jgi:hypothetical protein